MSKKERIDVLLVEKGFFASREKARAAIMAGLVFVQEERCEKPGTKVEESVSIRVKGELHPYVSRGGLKLEKAIKSFGLEMEDAVVMDIGASTGGFTDCALQNGAKQVYAIDVGYGQLDWKLRSDSRVIVMERTNFRHLQPEQLKGEKPNFATIDVSFISLKIILPVLSTFLEPGAHVVALVKPQFEAGREQVGKNGIVREASIHEQVLTSIVEFSSNLGYFVQGIDYSPITGGEGNIEFLLLLRWRGKEQNQEPVVDAKEIQKVVEKAHSIF